MKYERLGNIIEISKGKKHNQVKEPTLKSTRIIGINDLRNDNDIIFTNDNSGIEACENDILIAWDGANAGTIGYGKKGYIGSTISRLRMKNIKRYYTPFIGRLLQSKFEYLRATATGSTIPHLNRIALTSIRVPSFNYSDQVRIATILNRSEKLIAKRKESIKLLDELLQSIFLEMFGDPVRNEKGWEKRKLKFFGQIITGNTPPRNDKENYSSDFIEWIKTDNIDANKTYLTTATEYLSEKGCTKARIVTPGALLIACIAGSVESIGRAAIADRQVSFNQQINAIQPNEKINPFFLYWLFKISKLYLQSHANKGMKKIVTKGDFEKIIMICPPPYLQEQFAVAVGKIEPLKSKYTYSLIEMENLYNSLSERVFEGGLNLSKVLVDVAIELEATMGKPIAHENPTSNKFSKKELMKIIKTLSGRPFSFYELWKNVEQASFKTAPEYEEIKDMIYTMLKGKNPVLKQSFEEIPDETAGERVKKIVLRVNV